MSQMYLFRYRLPCRVSRRVGNILPREARGLHATARVEIQAMSSEGPDEVLLPLQAAIRLGITPELLFNYTRPSLAKAARLDHALATIEHRGSTMFRTGDLDAFDRLLAGPWVGKNESRIAIPKSILDHLRAESGNQCTRCGYGSGVETAHIVPWEVGRSHHPYNLIRICSSCHSEHDLSKSLPTAELRRLKDRLVEQTRSKCKARMAPVDRHFVPPTPVTSVGFKDHLAWLIQGLQEGRCILVVGVAGIGKTQLALRALNETHTGRPVVWLEVEKYRSRNEITSALLLSIGADLQSAGILSIAERLDVMQACVVFDGVEQGDSSDEIEDFITGLLAATSMTQIVVTSQLRLQRLPVDGWIRLERLGAEAARDLLLRSCRESRSALGGAATEILAFCDGHPLTIILVGALVDFVGSGFAALERIQAFGADAVRLHKRSIPSRATSLSVSLSLAYEALDQAELKTLAVLANAPGGLSRVHLERGRWQVADAPMAVAGLRRWNLIMSTNAGESFERINMLSAVRTYVLGRWEREHGADALDVKRMLFRHLAELAMVINRRSSEDVDPWPMMHRYSQELPNLVRAVEVANDHAEDDHLAESASMVAAALMSFFFIQGSSEHGLDVMSKVSGLQLRRGELKLASDTTVQLTSLSRRARSQKGFSNSRSRLNEIEQANIPINDPLVAANVYTGRAICAMAERRPAETVSLCRLALLIYLGYEAATSEEGFGSDIADVQGLLGDALLELGNVEEARQAYRESLKDRSPESEFVNRGQVLHQLGNCENRLRNAQLAIDCYAEAAKTFHLNGMQEYLSNALGELGHCMVHNDLSFRDTSIEQTFERGLQDVLHHVQACLMGGSKIEGQLTMVVRKLYGLICLVSFSTSSDLLGSFSQAILSPVEAPDDAPSNVQSVFAYECMIAGSLASEIAKIDGKEKSGNRFTEDDYDLLATVLEASSMPEDVFDLFSWLSKYENMKKAKPPGVR
jgi:tetratricopeptide (TPR) repeat protein